MPELPEVEVARRFLARWLVGQPIERVWAQAGTPLRGTTPAALARRLRGRTVRRVERIGKHLFWTLDGEVAVHAHLGMTGKFVGAQGEPPRRPHERLRLEAGGRAILFIDPRRFGRFELIAAAPLGERHLAFGLGPDALEEPLRPTALAARLARTQRPLKVALMDQTLLAGLGNIQVSEILFRAKLSPFAKPQALSSADWRKLAAAIRASLRATLRASAASREGELTYVEEPGAPNPFRVYARAGEPCPRCGTSLVRRVQAQRSTFYCPSCQGPS